MIRRLSRDRGTIVACNSCDATVYTASISATATRHYASTLGWGRGICPPIEPREERRSKLGKLLHEARDGSPSTLKHDYCPACLLLDRAAAEELKKNATARLLAKDARLKARDALMRAGAEQAVSP